MRSSLGCVLAAAIIAGCARNAPGAPTTAPSGEEALSRPRIISLAPSLTEIAFTVGCKDALIGDTTFDDYPSEARALAHVGDLAHADLERIAALHPTIVLALHDQEREGAPVVARLHVPVVYLPNRNLADLYADVTGVAAACGTQSQGAALNAQLRARIERVSARTAHKNTRPTVLYLLGLPGFTAGKRSYINDAIGLAGGVNVAGDVDQPYPDLTEEAIIRADPDIVIVSKSVGFDQAVRAREPWRSLAAVREGRVYSPPDDSILERDGPRIVQGLEWLSSVFEQAESTPSARAPSASPLR